jgi:hypothetical protein
MFVYFVRMGREMHPKMTWQARIQGKRHQRQTPTDSVRKGTGDLERNGTE